MQVVERVQQKLTGSLRAFLAPIVADLTAIAGRDFKPTVVLTVTEQVDKLISQATSLENLSQCFIGWVSASFHSPFLESRADSPSCLSVRSGSRFAESYRVYVVTPTVRLSCCHDENGLQRQECGRRGQGHFANRNSPDQARL